MDSEQYMYNGISVIASPHIRDDYPVIELSEKVTVTPEFRKECNEKYLEWFGVCSKAFMTNGTMIVSDKVFIQMKKDGK